MISLDTAVCVECQRDHRRQHKKACKKRAAELRDEILFRQPESTHEGAGPICCVPLPMDGTKSAMMPCCSTLICTGCSYANQVCENQMRERVKHLERLCPFCRQPRSFTQEEFYVMKRAKVNDPVALREVGKRRYDEGEYNGAFEYVSKAAELGDIETHYSLSFMYDKGEGVDKDKKKELHYLEEAAIGGHPYARNNLGCVEVKRRID